MEALLTDRLDRKMYIPNRQIVAERVDLDGIIVGVLMRVNNDILQQDTIGILASAASTRPRLDVAPPQSAIGRASCRERGWQYVYSAVVAVPYKKTKQR